MRILTKNGAYEVYEVEQSAMENGWYSVRFRGIWNEIVLAVSEEDAYSLVEEIYESGYCDLSQYRTDQFESEVGVFIRD